MNHVTVCMCMSTGHVMGWRGECPCHPGVTSPKLTQAHHLKMHQQHPCPPMSQTNPTVVKGVGVGKGVVCVVGVGSKGEGWGWGGEVRHEPTCPVKPCPVLSLSLSLSQTCPVRGRG